jgi:hypothetical protein
MSYQEQETTPEEINPNGQDVPTLLRIIATMDPEDANEAWSTLIETLRLQNGHQPNAPKPPHFALSGPGTGPKEE